MWEFLQQRRARDRMLCDEPAGDEIGEDKPASVNYRVQPFTDVGLLFVPQASCKARVPCLCQRCFCLTNVSMRGTEGRGIQPLYSLPVGKK